MSQTNGSVLRGFFEEVLNQRNPDLLSKYFSDNYIGHVTPYVGVGVGPDFSSGEKVIIRMVVPGGPSDGKLMVGDELLRISDGDCTWETFDEIRNSTWGHGPLDTAFTVWVRREGQEHEITLTRGLIQGVDIPYHFVEDGISELFETWPDWHSRLVQVLEVGDLVAYHAEHQGYNARFGRSAVWSEFGFVRVQGGKITDWWSNEDLYSQYKQLGYTIEEPSLAKK